MCGTKPVTVDSRRHDCSGKYFYRMGAKPDENKKGNIARSATLGETGCRGVDKDSCFARWLGALPARQRLECVIRPESWSFGDGNYLCGSTGRVGGLCFYL